MFDVLNNSKFFAGLTMLAVNLGSKYLAHELSDSQQELFNNKIIADPNHDQRNQFRCVKNLNIVYFKKLSA